MTLQRWRHAAQLSQAQVALRLGALAPKVIGRPFKVTQSRVSDLEAGTRPNREMLLLLHVLSRGLIDANAFYELPDWRVWKETLEKVEAAER